MRSNKNKFAFSETHLQKIKSKIEEKTGVQLNQDNKNQAFKSARILRKPVTIIALMICFAVLSSAAAVIYQTQYIPLKGFVESGEYEVYCTPEILKLGDYATVETVMRVKDGKSSDLSIIITDTPDENIKIITKKHGEFNLTPARNYNYSSFGTMGKYQFTNEIGYSSYGYYIENFPEINEFTLVNGSESTEVKLTASNSGDVLTAEDSGISVRFYSMSKGSRVLAYEIYEDKSDFENILGIKFPNISYRSLELGPGMEAFQVYDENGNKIFMNGYHSDTGPDGLSTVMFLRTEHGEKISKMEADYIGGVVGTDFTAKIMAAEDVPVPADGEEITFNDGLLLYDRNGLTSKLTAIKRQGNEITIYTNSEYIGEHIENTDIYINWNGGLGSNMSGWTGHRIFNINGDEEFIKLYIDAIYYKINGSWEITFE